MPDPDPPSSSEPSATRNLPVPVARPNPVARETGDGWLRRALRTILGLRSSTIRANLEDVLEDGAGETGFSPPERTMLRNILGLRERASPTSWCRAPISSPCSATSRSASS
jgi:hypothetical protein